MSQRILNALGILSADMPTGNMVWVDRVNGVDGLAVRGRMTIPFRTLGAAKTAAQSGDTIMVLPGTYDEKNLLKNGVNWHFLPGAKVNYAGSPSPASGALFDTSAATGSNGAVTCAITGHGEFTNGASAGTNHVLYCDNSSSNISIQGRSMFAQAHVAIKVTAGKCQIQVSEDITALGADVVLANGGILGVNARDLTTSGGCCLRVQSGSGTVELVGRRFSASVDHAISIEGGSSSASATIRAYELLSSGGTTRYGVHYNNTGGSILTILGARIWRFVGGASEHAVYIASSSSDKVKLANCVLIAGSGASASMKAASAGTRVHILNGAAANYGFTNITQVGGTLNTADTTIT